MVVKLAKYLYLRIYIVAKLKNKQAGTILYILGYYMEILYVSISLWKLYNHAKNIPAILLDYLGLLLQN